MAIKYLLCLPNVDGRAQEVREDQNEFEGFVHDNFSEPAEELDFGSDAKNNAK